MPTRARSKFEDNWQTVSNLMDLSGGEATSHAHREARNKAALVFCITVWESYVEDVASEAIEFLAKNAKNFASLPPSVQETLNHAVTPKPNNKYVDAHRTRPSSLADDGWRHLYVRLGHEATQGHNFNSPDSKNVRKLFKTWCGVDITQSWRWKGFALGKPAERLDHSIKARGSIVHTGQKPEGINKNWINTYGDINIRKIVECTENFLIGFINETCALDANSDGAFGTAGY